MAKIAIIYYSTYGHVATMAEEIKAGIEADGATCDVYRVAETLPDEVLAKMYAPPKNEGHPVITTPDRMTAYDGFMFGVSGRYGIMPAQLKVRTSGHCSC
jgi:NAD(P)H dehydrogenase (quinone)